jgi:hypothetical protein
MPESAAVGFGGHTGRCARRAAASLRDLELGARVVAEACADEKGELDLLLIGRAALVAPFTNRDLDGVRADSIGCVRELPESPEEDGY